MIRVAFVRGAFLNNFEAQNYCFKSDIQLTGIGTFTSIHSRLPFPVKKMFSPIDMVRVSPIKQIPFSSRIYSFITNRTWGDGQRMYGLEKVADNFDIFHTADPHYYYSYQLADLRAQGKIKKLLVTSWDTIAFNNETVDRKKYIKRFVLKHADRFLCYTGRARDALVMEGVEQSKIDVVPLGVDLNRFAPTPPEEEKKGCVTILFVGRLVKEKGVLDLYEAYKKMKHRTWNIEHKKTRLIIVGEGYLRNNLINMVASDGLQSEVTIESRSYTQIPYIYKQADIFVMPSKHTKTWEEQYGMVLPEAMASGLSVVAYDSGAIAEVSGKAALIVTEGNIVQLTNSLVRLVKDKKERTKFQERATYRARLYFDSRKTAEAIGRIYHKLI